MSEMIERVAMAQAGERWNSFSEEHRDAARSLARVAIGAMREPTAAMMPADPPCGAPRIGWADEIAGDYWRRMIDAALK